MERKTTITKIAIASAVLTILAFCFAAAPLVVTCLFAVAALILLLIALLCYLLGGLIGLILYAVDSGILSTVGEWGGTLVNWSGKLFGFIKGITQFWLDNIMSFAPWVGIVLGAIGIVISIYALVAAKRNSQTQPLEAQEETEEEIIFESNKKPKKKKRLRKPKTNRQCASISLALNIVFLALSVILLISANTFLPALFA